MKCGGTTCMEVPAKGLNKESSFCVNRKKKSIAWLELKELVQHQQCFNYFSNYSHNCAFVRLKIAKMFVAM